MGRDKASELVGGVSMLETAVAALAGAAGVSEVVVVSSRPETPTGPWRIVPDGRPGGGPLAAIETALVVARDTDAEGVFVLACDLPLIDTTAIDQIVRGLGEARASAALRDGTPGFEPLCAAYRSDCVGVVKELLGEGHRAAWRLFDAVDGVTVDVAADGLLNVNTPADLERARRAGEAG